MGSEDVGGGENSSIDSRHRMLCFCLIAISSDMQILHNQLYCCGRTDEDIESEKGADLFVRVLLKLEKTFKE